VKIRGIKAKKGRINEACSWCIQINRMIDFAKRDIERTGPNSSIKSAGPPNVPEMFRKDENNQRDRGRGDHPPAVPIPELNCLKTLKTVRVIKLIKGLQCNGG